MPEIADPVLDRVAAEAAMPVPAAVRAVVEAARARLGPSALAVLFYGSCLRDGEDRGRLVDLFVLTDGYAGLPMGRLLRGLTAWLPPAVFQITAAHAGRTVRAKVAVVDLARLERLVGPETLEPYFWARFAQPTALAWARDAAVARRVHRLLARAVRTLAAAARPLLRPAPTPVELFERAFALTYRTELRAEPPGRAAAIVAAAAERYERLGTACLAELPAPDARAVARAERLWAWRRVEGKARSVLRLAKAAFTFEGGADYLAWKIERHSGERIELTPWQRRHPVLAGLLLLPRLRRRGAVR
jgi:hypothetical protein